MSFVHQTGYTFFLKDKVGQAGLMRDKVGKAGSTTKAPKYCCQVTCAGKTRSMLIGFQMKGLDEVKKREKLYEHLLISFTQNTIRWGETCSLSFMGLGTWQ